MTSVEIQEPKVKKKIPIWKAVKAVYVQTWHNKYYALYFSLPIIFVIFLFRLAFDFAEGKPLIDSFGEFMLPSQNEFLSGTNEISIAIKGTVMFFVTSLSWSVVAVFWHQCLLTDKTSDFLKVSQIKIALRYLFFAIFYLLISATIFGILFLLLFLITLPFNESISVIMHDVNPKSAALVIVCSIFTVVSVILTRMLISLPAIAVDQKNFSLLAGWRASRGNNIRILICSIFLFIFAFIISFIIGFIAAFARYFNDYVELIFLIAATPVQMLMIVAGITQITLFYRFFVEDKPI